MVSFDPTRIAGSRFFGGAAPPAAAAPAPQPQQQTVEAKPEPAPVAAQPAQPPAQDKPKPTKAAPAPLPAQQQTAAPATTPTAIATRQPQGLAQTTGVPMVLELDGGGALDISGWVENDPGMGDLSELKSPLPVVSAAYSQSKIVEEMGLTEGLWTHQATGEQTAELSLVVIDVKLRRDLRAKYDSGKDEQLPVICEATDGRHGEGSDKFDIEVMPGRPFVSLSDSDMVSGAFNIEPGRSCKLCPYAEWRDTKDGRKPPLCRETYNVVADDAVFGPIVVPFRGKGIKPLTRWRTAWWLKVGRFQGAFRAQTGRHLPASLFGVTPITLRKEKTYYVPEFGAVEPTQQDRFYTILQNHAVYASVVDMLGSHDAMAAIEQATSFDPANLEG